ncbi:RagB/SusD family nutrient uptake outer membrane protein [Sinomicrobium weinanense]|uniref:RagB/SusD family nutrient uptake outer membrane protein n=1 Tax=Sinomicrobium weinanense TaxID=2842200 RepID=A0A926JWJ8_9FLAO|nr:RagB/SusD family nutrient uptake outer membrane protein [Sinomicrobium weinanense]MBC9798498.1 RagB/SusD family nutrient uptake outer membrane protein [Sinomicrobium weinanense]MBU3126011.1 RagB/SusD family nutrient uptake outer membrane protein [Sinomicrobium weinanense]
MRKILYILLVCVGFGLQSCSDSDLEPNLSQNKNIDLSINNEEDLKGLLYGAYDRMSRTQYYGRDYIVYGEVRSDNMYSNANSNRFVNAAEMNMVSTDAYPSDTWERMYQVIASVNTIINKDPEELEEGVDMKAVNHFKGQAFVIRALVHFDLVKLYGQQHVEGQGGLDALGVPYVTTFREEDNLYPSRSTVAEVRDMAMSDLDAALDLMSEELDDTSKQTITTNAVNAIRARIALYFGDWNTALAAAKAVIDSGKFQITEADKYKDIFSTDSTPNSIFELGYNAVNNEGINGLANIYQNTNYGDVVVLQDLLDMYEEDDVRAAPEMINKTGDYLRNVGKYSSLAPYDDNIFVIRYEEMILIYAEALLETGNSGEALTYLNMIPAERNASPYSEATKDNILLERRKELAFEGFRFDDLARTGSDIPLVDGLDQTHGGPDYGSYNYAFPIPFSEIGANSNIVQNQGY